MGVALGVSVFVAASLINWPRAPQVPQVAVRRSLRMCVDEASVPVKGCRGDATDYRDPSLSELVSPLRSIEAGPVPG